MTKLKRYKELIQTMPLNNVELEEFEYLEKEIEQMEEFWNKYHTDLTMNEQKLLEQKK